MLGRADRGFPQRLYDKERQGQRLHTKQDEVARGDAGTPREEGALELVQHEDGRLRPPPAELSRNLLGRDVRGAARERGPRRVDGERAGRLLAAPPRSSGKGGEGGSVPAAQLRPARPTRGEGGLELGPAQQPAGRERGAAFAEAGGDVEHVLVVERRGVAEPKRAADHCPSGVGRGGALRKELRLRGEGSERRGVGEAD
mmetsp:Transcript_28281/g.93991  ORF Transcript_28281/g.93991 Transcript_28281/m.93991 type:complete len:200 (-) Transcript_28281:160-759(-)